MLPNSPQRQAVQALYNTYPFPPEPLLQEPPPGYNWRWQWTAVHNFCLGRRPSNQKIRILDAGCGTGVGTEYLVHLNPEATIHAIDISEGALQVAQERLQKSGVWCDRASFQQLPLENAASIPGQFDYINSVGVLHHLPDPIAGIQALAEKLAPGGLFHIFVYAEIGRWEIQLMQRAIAILQGEKRGDYQDGVAVGRQIFASLPEYNRLVKREKERWSLENHRDESFADMYVHPQETDYNIDTLFELIDSAGLEFLGFSNPDYWQLDRLLGKAPDLMERAKNLGEKERYRLIELLDPEITHYEFFLAKPPVQISDWADDGELLQAKPGLHPCVTGWPSRSLFDYNYQPLELTEAEFKFLQEVEKYTDSQANVATILANLGDQSIDLALVRSLQTRQLLTLSKS
ncbi:class I SAM-dependent methyltransferase [Synechocystis sp. FACHB-383]|uniref:class I SAM-dependent methyltransferase n=1 Tax=Synechocystis sp. FACHB-383 TaxID=2692864 RepID=UPI0016835D55|nr:class I SAM-dependent methyltransferase [Synechocystis sp. FACHB-383]MBD2653283.1 class I SAM-dependent methyltransferase [Synechocystis sp. FACHB-383]